jgi:carboxyl-terminal processing protease
MQIKKISKFVLGVCCGGVVALGVSSFASTDIKQAQSVAIVNQQVSSQLSPNQVVPIPVDEINNFAKAYAITKSYYVESVPDSKMMKGAINGMLSNLDPHSSYLDKEAFKQLNEMITYGAFAGLGIEVSRERDNSGIKVVAPIDGTPAFLAGIKSGDVIIKIDGQPVSNMTLDEAIKKMRGVAGTSVKLTISRELELKPLNFTIIRAEIKIKSVKYAMLAPDYAYLRITNFQVDTTSSMVSVLTTILREHPNLKGLVLDLRDNPGGLLQGAVGVAGGFLPKESLIVYTDGRVPDARHKFYNTVESVNKLDVDNLDKLSDVFKILPIVVMINQGTASASEIVAGALQDYKRAKIVGVKSFGKGSVQTVIPLTPDTAVKLTTALYYTPKGRSIQAQGIKPDIIIRSEYEDVLSSWDLSEAALENHLNNPNAGKAEKTMLSKDKDNTLVITPAKQIRTQAELKLRKDTQIKAMPKVVDQNLATINLKDDFQLQWALNILEGKPLPVQTSQKLK